MKSILQSLMLPFSGSNGHFAGDCKELQATPEHDEKLQVWNVIFGDAFCAASQVKLLS